MSRWRQIEAGEAVLEREIGTVYKDPGGKLTVVLAYPNTYYVGMSSLALQILYGAFNARPDVACERAFWDPAAAAAGEPLVSLESATDLARFDVWAFTVSFEMDYFHVAAMFAQAGVPALAEERRADRERWPLLIAGGPAVTMNPEPLAPFFDALVLGEAEELIGPLFDNLVALAGRAGGDASQREQVLDALDRLPGVYVPSRVTPRTGGRRITRGWVRDLSTLEPAADLYTPDTEFSGMRLVEIARGCGRGCRYCLAGYLYRPPREQPAGRVLGWAREILARQAEAAGDEEQGAGNKRPRRGSSRSEAGGRRARPRGIGLVAAAVSDHSEIDNLAAELQGMGARITVSSMRTDPLSLPLLRALAASGTQTLTIAPEAGTERLRRAINKPQTEESLLAAVAVAQELGFPQLKMYYMVGHPSETDDDIQGIVDLTLRARALFRRNLTINATPFVPKAHTPFQRAGVVPAKILQERQKRLERSLARHRVTVKADSPAWAEVQAVLARGDRRLAAVLMSLVDRVQAGALTVSAFEDALAAHDLAAEEFRGEWSPEAWLPWEFVDTGLSAKYVAYEARLAGQDRAGHSCFPVTTGCRTCGMCGEETGD